VNRMLGEPQFSTVCNFQPSLLSTVIAFNRHCERSEAIQLAAQRKKLDCFAEPVIGRAFARPVGSQ